VILVLLSVSHTSESPIQDLDLRGTATTSLTPSTIDLFCRESPRKVFQHFKRFKDSDAWLHFAVCKEYTWEPVPNSSLDNTSPVSAWHPCRPTDFLDSSPGIDDVAVVGAGLQDGDLRAEVCHEKQHIISSNSTDCLRPTLHLWLSGLVGFFQALSVGCLAQFTDSSVGSPSFATQESPSADAANNGSQSKADTSAGNGGTPGAGQMRRWQRWTAIETQALRNALNSLGTSNWAAIKDHMRTDRTVKQVLA
jgi:hypothetical protein